MGEITIGSPLVVKIKKVVITGKNSPCTVFIDEMSCSNLYTCSLCEYN